MKKFYLGVAFMLVLCAGDALAAGFQVDGVRVGPSAEEKAAETADAPAPKKDEKKSARASEETKSPRDSDKTRTNDKTRNASTLSNSTASASAPPATNNASGTSDAPSKTGAEATVPVGTPVKNASAPAADPEANKGDASTPSSVPANPTTTPPNTVANSNNVSANSNAAANPSAGTATGLASSTANVPLTSVYRIGIGDVLDIRLLNEQDPRQSTLYTVLAGGVLDYPLLRDPLTVTGMTTDELAAQLIADFRHRGLFIRPQVRVGVREYASHAVLVSGLANDPGTKILRREAIPLYVVVAEAQPKPEAGRAVIISHSTEKVTTVDLNDAAGLNTLVLPGDVVNLTVRPPEFFYVGGEVGSPGQKDFHAGLTLTQALLASGGVTRLAGDKVKVARAGSDGRLVSTEYNLREIEGGVVPDPLLQAGDRIEVSPRANKK